MQSKEENICLKCERNQGCEYQEGFESIESCAFFEKKKKQLYLPLLLESSLKDLRSLQYSLVYQAGYVTVT